VKLYEVSICTFPAYEETNISARTAQRDHIRERQLDAWKTKMKGVLKNGTESPAAEKED
jgi:phage head maturation protease